MKLLKKSLLLSVSLIFVTYEAIAMQDDRGSSAQIRRAVLKNLVEDSYKYSVEHPNRRPDHQYPRATIVFCSDSRCQTSELDQTPEEDLFVVRNIGNQFELTKGSIWYGVKHLETPLLLFVGHSNCGAIRAKLDGTERAPDEKVPPYVKKELSTLYVGENQQELNQGIIANVHHQVTKAQEELEFQPLIASGKLTVMGALYDFRDDFGRGANNLIFINVNGEINPIEIGKHPDLKGSFNSIVGVGEVEKKIISKL